MNELSHKNENVKRKYLLLQSRKNRQKKITIFLQANPRQYACSKTYTNMVEELVSSSLKLFQIPQDIVWQKEFNTEGGHPIGRSTFSDNSKNFLHYSFSLSLSLLFPFFLYVLFNSGIRVFNQIPGKLDILCE